MVAQDSHQNNVGCSWHRPEQGQTVATVADCNRAPAERKQSVREEGHTAESKAGGSVL